jgi:hypothetical protein
MERSKWIPLECVLARQVIPSADSACTAPLEKDGHNISVQQNVGEESKEENPGRLLLWLYSPLSLE